MVDIKVKEQRIFLIVLRENPIEVEEVNLPSILFPCEVFMDLECNQKIDSPNEMKQEMYDGLSLFVRYEGCTYRLRRGDIRYIYGPYTLKNERITVAAASKEWRASDIHIRAVFNKFIDYSNDSLPNFNYFEARSLLFPQKHSAGYKFVVFNYSLKGILRYSAPLKYYIKVTRERQKVSFYQINLKFKKAIEEQSM